MSATPLEKATTILKQVSVATLATALFKRGLRNQVIQGVRPVRSHHNLPAKQQPTNMVGPAFTLRYMPAREDRNSLAEFQNPEHLQRQAIGRAIPRVARPGWLRVGRFQRPPTRRNAATAGDAGCPNLQRRRIRPGRLGRQFKRNGRVEVGPRRQSRRGLLEWRHGLPRMAFRLRR